eukprot:Gb_18084 [translate_table: standard]
MMQEAPISDIVVGSSVWVSDSHGAWIAGKVQEINGQQVRVLTTRRETVSSGLSSVYPKDDDALHGGVDDMTKLTYLHQPGALQNLATRYNTNEIYTYAGRILIAINPCKKLPHLYDDQMMEEYKGSTFGELQPHVFSVAEAAYRLMITEGKSQSILIIGESGAGKTETAKFLMNYLAFVGNPSSDNERKLKQQVLQSTVVLKAFGNAKTVRCNNSSRFGQFVQLHFDTKGKISGASIKTYLLEKSRVCKISDPERNYNCFYQICAAPPEIIEKYKLQEHRPGSFHYLNQSNCYELDGISDADKFAETRNAMNAVGISEGEQDSIFRVIAAILHLGNVDFTEGKEPDSCIPNGNRSIFHLKTAAELFMCDAKGLEDSLCKCVIVTPRERITKSLDPIAASSRRDILAKTVYSRLFEWLVSKINELTGRDFDSKTCMKIGILDICGFEIFDTNSFEQFCINFTNEKLQQHFIKHVLRMEQEQYKTEEINWNNVDFVDNQDVLDIIEKRPGGIIALLDDACMFPESTDETFAENLYKTFGNHKRFRKPKFARSEFIIEHSYNDVTYKTDMFLDKNKEHVVAEHQTLLCTSKCTFVSSLFRPLEESSKFSSIATCFKKELQFLMGTLSSTEPHYIRCVKPNDLLEPGSFDNSNVLKQLHCGSVMEAIRISGAGYPIRRTFDEFLRRFHILDPTFDSDQNYDKKIQTKKILDTVGITDYQIGKTKVFLRAGQITVLDTRRSEVLLKAVKVIQRTLLSYIAWKQRVSKRIGKTISVDIDAVLRENENLKASVNSLESKANEAERRYAECQKLSEVSHYKAIEVELEKDQLRTSLASQEEILKKLESENRDLREKIRAMEHRPNKGLLGWLIMPVVCTIVSWVSISPWKIIKQFYSHRVHRKARTRNEDDELQNTQLQPSQDDRQHVKHLAATQGTGVFYYILEMACRATENKENNDVLAYWLSNLSTLLFLLHNTLGATEVATQHRTLTSVQSSERTTNVVQQSSSSSMRIGNVINEPNSGQPVLVFKKKLTDYVEKIYAIIRDNFKEDISFFLGLCVQKQRMSGENSVKVSSRVHHTNEITAEAAPSNHWQCIIHSLSNLLQIMRANHVPRFLVLSTFTQIFSFMNVQLFNSLLLRRECCSYSSGEYLRAGLTELEHWCNIEAKEFTSSAWDELRHIRQAVQFLVINKKSERSLNEIIHDLCQDLTTQQLHRIITMYWDDEYGTQSVSAEVIENIRVLITEESSTQRPFLLKYDSSIPFSFDDMSSATDLSYIEPSSQLVRFILKNSFYQL